MNMRIANAFKSASQVWVVILVVACTGLLGCTANSKSGDGPLLARERNRLKEEGQILVYGEKEELNGLSVITLYRGGGRSGGIRTILYGSLGLVRAPYIRDKTINRIRSLTGLTNFMLLDAPLTRDMSSVDRSSHDAIHRSAYHGVYLVFRSGWRMIDDPAKLLWGSGLHFTSEGELIRPTDVDDEILWRTTCHIVAVDPPFLRGLRETGEEWFRRLNTTNRADGQEMGQRLADFCADHLALSFAGEAPAPSPEGMRLLHR